MVQTAGARECHGGKIARLGFTATTPLRVGLAATVRWYLDNEPWSWEVSFYPRDLAEATGIDSPHDIHESLTHLHQQLISGVAQQPKHE